MDLQQRWTLLGGLTPAQFMRRHWQRQPLLVRGAWPGAAPPVTRQELFELAAHAEVESRLVVRQPSIDPPWRLRRGPLPRRTLPPLKRAGWTLLVQGLDLHVEQAHAMLSRFRFVPDARLDDLMLSFATDGGGVGPHVDSYDVFLLQVQGRRRWRVGPVGDGAIVDGLPLRILKHFEPQQEWVLEPGDMLYLPPHWGHDGIAIGECMTCSIGFRVPTAASVASELLARLADHTEGFDRAYDDPRQAATAQPGRVPARLQAFASRSVQAQLRRPLVLTQLLGEMLTEPKPQVWFDEGALLLPGQGARLDRRTRMMYDDHHVFINGESCRAAGSDARLMARLADARQLGPADLARLSRPARQLLSEWAEQGWLHALPQEGS